MHAGSPSSTRATSWCRAGGRGLHGTNDGDRNTEHAAAVRPRRSSSRRHLADASCTRGRPYVADGTTRVLGPNPAQEGAFLSHAAGESFRPPGNDVIDASADTPGHRHGSRRCARHRHQGGACNDTITGTQIATCSPAVGRRRHPRTGRRRPDLRRLGRQRRRRRPRAVGADHRCAATGGRQLEIEPRRPGGGQRHDLRRRRRRHRLWRPRHRDAGAARGAQDPRRARH